jgi:PadR family transcriptional regulator
MPGRTGLGELELLVLLAIRRLGNEAYGAAIRETIQAETGRAVTPGAIYPTLDRLERKGCVRSFTGEPTAERGGRARRHFTLLPAGQREMQRAWGHVAALARGLPLASRSRRT